MDDATQPSDAVYQSLSPYGIIMLGEMHGTNESAPFVNGLVNLFVAHGDSVQVGFEIPPALMTEFISKRNDSSVYASTFFRNPPFLDGKETVAWANLIATLNRNAKVHMFFYDANAGEAHLDRDSLMYAKIKAQCLPYKNRRTILLGGNYHNRLDDAANTVGHLNADKDIAAHTKVCSLNNEYLEGTANANFGHGLEVKRLGHPSTDFDTAMPCDLYFLLFPTPNNYPYNGFFYTRYITAATTINKQ